LRMDASPDIHAYLRFIVSGLNGKTIFRARLMLYTKSSAALGLRVMAVADNTWNELDTNYNNAPALGDKVALASQAETASWVEFEVTPYVTGEGRFNFGIITNSITAVSLASRETGANAPQLILDLR
jgi:acid phosphatase type 7